MTIVKSIETTIEKRHDLSGNTVELRSTVACGDSQRLLWVRLLSIDHLIERGVFDQVWDSMGGEIKTTLIEMDGAKQGGIDAIT